MLILPMGNIVVDGVTMDFLKFEVEPICFFSVNFCQKDFFLKGYKLQAKEFFEKIVSICQIFPNHQ
jgi:hypothetical protein